MEREKKNLGFLEGGYGGGENFLGSLEGGDGGGQKGFSLMGEKKFFPCRGIRGGRKKFSSAGGYEG